ncbi:hypothetical protein AAF712_015179 [Marasmius tenuissimus]|uniref:Uncharacterized protein n=1 Tax=Marasmius tenuissimus TaxID=585030 RepID=A0ABR2Z902_9AGAR
MPTRPQFYLDSHTTPPPSAIADLDALLTQDIMSWRELSDEQEQKQEPEPEEEQGEERTEEGKRRTFLRRQVQLPNYWARHGFGNSNGPSNVRWDVSMKDSKLEDANVKSMLTTRTNKTHTGTSSAKLSSAALARQRLDEEQAAYVVDFKARLLKDLETDTKMREKQRLKELKRQEQEGRDGVRKRLGSLFCRRTAKENSGILERGVERTENVQLERLPGPFGFVAPSTKPSAPSTSAITPTPPPRRSSGGTVAPVSSSGSRRAQPAEVLERKRRLRRSRSFAGFRPDFSIEDMKAVGMETANSEGPGRDVQRRQAYYF